MNEPTKRHSDGLQPSPSSSPSSSTSCLSTSSPITTSSSHESSSLNTAFPTTIGTVTKEIVTSNPRGSGDGPRKSDDGNDSQDLIEIVNSGMTNEPTTDETTQNNIQPTLPKRIASPPPPTTTTTTTPPTSPITRLYDYSFNNRLPPNGRKTTEETLHDLLDSYSPIAGIGDRKGKGKGRRSSDASGGLNGMGRQSSDEGGQGGEWDIGFAKEVLEKLKRRMGRGSGLEVGKIDKDDQDERATGSDVVAPTSPGVRTPTSPLVNQTPPPPSSQAHSSPSSSSSSSATTTRGGVKGLRERFESAGSASSSSSVSVPASNDRPSAGGADVRFVVNSRTAAAADGAGMGVAVGGKGKAVKQSQVGGETARVVERDRAATGGKGSGGCGYVGNDAEVGKEVEVLEKVIGMFEILAHAHSRSISQQSDLTAQLKIANSNLALAVANADVLEESLRRRYSVAGHANVRSPNGSGSVYNSPNLQDQPFATFDLPNSPEPLPAPPTPPQPTSSFWRMGSMSSSSSSSTSAAAAARRRAATAVGSHSVRPKLVHSSASMDSPPPNVVDAAREENVRLKARIEELEKGENEVLGILRKELDSLRIENSQMKEERYVLSAELQTSSSEVSALQALRRNLESGVRTAEAKSEEWRKAKEGMEDELENLSAELFKEANAMVADERKRRAAAEEKVRELEVEVAELRRGKEEGEARKEAISRTDPISISTEGRGRSSNGIPREENLNDQEARTARQSPVVPQSPPRSPPTASSPRMYHRNDSLPSGIEQSNPNNIAQEASSSSNSLPISFPVHPTMAGERPQSPPAGQSQPPTRPASPTRSLRWFSFGRKKAKPSPTVPFSLSAAPSETTSKSAPASRTVSPNTTPVLAQYESGQVGSVGSTKDEASHPGSLPSQISPPVLMRSHSAAPDFSHGSQDAKDGFPGATVVPVSRDAVDASGSDGILHTANDRSTPNDASDVGITSDVHEDTPIADLSIPHSISNRSMSSITSDIPSINLPGEDDEDNDHTMYMRRRRDRGVGSAEARLLKGMAWDGQEDDASSEMDEVNGRGAVQPSDSSYSLSSISVASSSSSESVYSILVSPPDSSTPVSFPTDASAASAAAPMALPFSSPPRDARPPLSVSVPPPSAFIGNTSATGTPTVCESRRLQNPLTPRYIPLPPSPFAAEEPGKATRGGTGSAYSGSPSVSNSNSTSPGSGRPFDLAEFPIPRQRDNNHRPDLSPSRAAAASMRNYPSPQWDPHEPADRLSPRSLSPLPSPNGPGHLSFISTSSSRSSPVEEDLDLLMERITHISESLGFNEDSRGEDTVTVK